MDALPETRYTKSGVQSLKGVPGDWALFALAGDAASARVA